MENRCTIYEILVLYIFSMFYVLKEIVDRILLKLTDSNRKLYMRCQGRTALITGGTSGIGFETTRKLLSYGMNVIIGSNISAEESNKRVEALRTEFPKCKVEIWYVDLSSMDSVKTFAEKFLASGLSLHILINNAGIMFAPFKRTSDGFESHFAVNYLSHCLLTKLLLPRLKRSGSSDCYARIVNVSSCLHYLAKPDFENLNSEKGYCCHQSYMQSKLFQIMFTQSMNRFLTAANCPVVINSVHPGVVYTGLYKHVWWAPYLGPWLLQKPKKGAEVSVFAALSVELEKVGGKFIENCQFWKPSVFAQNSEMQNRLFNETWKLLSKWLDEDDDDLEPDLD